MEDNSGYRRVLTLSSVYRFAQWSIGADKALRIFASDFVDGDATKTVVDIGCGNADIRPHLVAASYIGVEPNESYAVAASRRLAPPDRVIHAGVGDDALIEALPERADVVMFVGVIHHLDDDLARQALALAGSLVGSSGRCVAIDPTIRPGQSRLSRSLVMRDRGRNVRSPDQLRSLFLTAFQDVTVTPRNDLLRVSYDHAITVATRPETGLDPSDVGAT